MHIKTVSTLSLNNLKHLPSYAVFLLKNHLREYSERMLHLTRELNLPLLKAFEGMSQEQMLMVSMETSREFLNYLAQNKAEEQIEASLIRWIKNQLPVLDQKDVGAEDITLFTFIRKNVLLYFIASYTKDADDIIALTQEIDVYTTRSETESINTYIDLLRNRIREQSYLNEKITNTSPGLIYLFNLPLSHFVFINQAGVDFFGLTTEELKRLGNKALENLIHPDDFERTNNFLHEIAQSKEDDTWLIEFRLKNYNGEYLWMNNTISIFKRDDENKPLEIIGNMINIQKEKETTEKLQQREKELQTSEELYKQAQLLSRIGHYTLDLKTNQIFLTEELRRICDLEMDKEVFEYSEVTRLRHPDDAEMVGGFIKKAIESHESFDFDFRLVSKKGVQKTVHAIGEIMVDDEGKSTKLVGTFQDVTERYEILEELKKSNTRHKQAEALAHIGSYLWDLETDKLEWSDEMFRIYGMEPTENSLVDFKSIQSLNHPDDNELVKKAVSESIAEKKPHDFYYRVILNDGVVRILRARGSVLTEKGKTKFVGTAQDVTEKQALITKLQESEKLFKQAQALAKLGNWAMDLKTNKLSGSDEIYNIYEIYAGKEISVETWSGYMHPEDKEPILNYLQECIETKTPYDKHHRIITKSGKIKTLHRKAEFIFDEKGEAIKLVGTTQDVTEQFHIQQQLKENQTFIRKIADATPSIISSYNIHTGKYTFISEGLKKLLGYETEEVREKGVAFFEKIIHPDDLKPIMGKNAEAIAEANKPENRDNNDIAESIYRMRHADGTYLWFHTYGTVFDRNAKGEVEHILNISLDVTDQYEAIRTIEEQEHFIEHIADASPTVLYVYDIASDSFAYVNREIFFVLGYTREEIQAMGSEVTAMIYHPEDINLLPERKLSTKKIAETDIMLQYECRMKNKEGEWQWFLVREVVFKTDEEGNIAQIVGAALDISRRKDMEKTLLQNSFQLEQSNASLEEFAYIASHDLKEPLRKISTFGDRLVASQLNNLTPEGKIYLNKIVDASQRMQTMINDLLSISMISGNKAFEPYSLQQILNETLQTLEYKIEQKNALIKADELPEMNIIPSQFRQLFQNLLSNSLKFVRSDVQTVITISCTYLKPQDLPSYQLGAAEKYLKLEFSDNGIGFENEFAGKIFAIFQRLHGRSEYEGSGIGLAICKKIVEHHGGLIFATGVPDQGASFTIILPA